MGRQAVACHIIHLLDAATHQTDAYTPSLAGC